MRGGGNTLLKNPSDCALFGDVVDVAVGDHGQTTEILLWNANHLGSNGRQLAEDAKLKPNIGVKDIIVDFHYPPQNEVISHLGKINITYKSGKGYVPTMFGDLPNVGANWWSHEFAIVGEGPIPPTTITFTMSTFSTWGKKQILRSSNGNSFWGG